jgi:hypothetical protein
MIRSGVTLCVAWGVASVVLLVSAAVGAGAPPVARLIADIDLAAPFHTRTPWRFTAVQEPPVDDPIMGEGKIPGPVHICIHGGAPGQCEPHLQQTVVPPAKDAIYSQPYSLDEARIVHPRGDGAAPLLLVQIASARSVDGGRLVLTQALAYRRDVDGFVSVYDHVTGSNHNEEVRYVDVGPLRGDIISAEPTSNAPFAYWVAVDAFTPGHAYRQVLRYRSATRYGDGNPLPVIDSETPNILARLGLWRDGEPLPVPARACAKPRLAHRELWCG